MSRLSRSLPSSMSALPDCSWETASWIFPNGTVPLWKLSVPGKFTLLSDCILSPGRQDLSSLWLSGNQGPEASSERGQPACLKEMEGTHRADSRAAQILSERGGKAWRIRERKDHFWMWRTQGEITFDSAPLWPTHSENQLKCHAHAIASLLSKGIGTPSSKETPHSEWTCLVPLCGFCVGVLDSYICAQLCSLCNSVVQTPPKGRPESIKFCITSLYNIPWLNAWYTASAQ